MNHGTTSDTAVVVEEVKQVAYASKLQQVLLLLDDAERNT
jgi:hypothetical protein